MMLEIRFDLEVCCEACGTMLNRNVNQRKRAGKIDIAPCEKCLEKARTEAYHDAMEAKHDS